MNDRDYFCMFLRVLALMLLFLGMQMSFLPRAALAQNGSESIQPATPLEWPVEGPVMKVGQPRSRQMRSVELEVPVSVANAAQQVLGGKPENWLVTNDLHYGPFEHPLPKSNRVVFMYNAGKWFVCSVRANRWARLNAPGCLPYINEVIADIPLVSTDLRNADKLANFIYYVVNLYTGEACETPRDFQGMEDEELVGFLKGREKNPKILRTLMPAPSLTKGYFIWQVACNLMTPFGGIKKWTFVIQTKHAIEVKELYNKEIRADGEFSPNVFF